MNEQTLKSVISRIQENQSKKPLPKTGGNAKYITIQFPKDNQSNKYDGDGLSALAFLAKRKANGVPGRTQQDPDVLRMVASEALTTYAELQGWKPEAVSTAFKPVAHVAS